MNSDRIVGVALAFSFVFIVGLLAGEGNAELRTTGPAIQVQKQQPNGHTRDVPQKRVDRAERVKKVT